uniref:Uncharacterized protein n=1 Tax=Rhizophora mucronata TaxID=61149 RepID=A0A2P2L2K7_RHIMU
MIFQLGIRLNQKSCVKIYCKIANW